MEQFVPQIHVESIQTLFVLVVKYESTSLEVFVECVVHSKCRVLKHDFHLLSRRDRGVGLKSPLHGDYLRPIWRSQTPMCVVVVY